MVTLRCLVERQLVFHTFALLLVPEKPVEHREQKAARFLGIRGTPIQQLKMEQDLLSSNFEPSDLVVERVHGMDQP
jgi:hypothetical protein